MTRLSRRPTRTQSRRFASGLSLFFLACLALLLICPVAVKADEEKEKYGPVIGIGAFQSQVTVAEQRADPYSQIWVPRK